MHFVGRENETRQIGKTLTEGNNVIVSGKYGIGRTSLIRHLAETTEERWRFIFVDFSQTPGDVCNRLLIKLFPRQELDRKRRKYRSNRFRIATLPLDDSRKQILVLDNVSKLTSQKQDLLRSLTWERRFQFVSIVEGFLPPDHLFLLRVRMNPSIFITLHYLSASDVAQFYRRLSREHRLGWNEIRIKNLVEVTGGYPLRMKEIALRELARNRIDH
jgi:MoxR-like ATPase